MYIDKVTTAQLPEITEPLSCCRKPNVNGWVLLDPDISHLKNVILRAQEFGINHFQISHGIVHSACTMFDEPWRIDRVNFIAQRARPKGIECYLWTHELDGIGDEFKTADGRVDMDKPELWQFLTERYQKVFEAVEIDGLVLTFQETQASVYHDQTVASCKTPSERVRILINNMNEICQSFGKKLLVRTFCYNNKEMNWILEGLAEVLPDVAVMVKCQPADWNPYLPHNRLIEHFANQGRGFVVEYDLGEEYHGQGEFPYLCTEYQRYRLNHMLNCQARLPEKTVCGAVARIERFGSSALGRLNEVNLHVFAAIMQRPDVDEQAAVDRVLREQFQNWALPVKKILAKTFDITNGVVYPWKATWGFMMHMAVADYMYIYDSLANWPQIEEWIDEPEVKSCGHRLLNADPEAHQQMLANMQVTEQQFDRLQDDMQDLAKQMPVELYVILAEGIRKLEAFVRINLAHHRTFLAVQRWEKEKNALCRQEALESFEQFQRQVRLHGAVLFCMHTEGVFLNRKGTDLFCQQVQAVLENGSEKLLGSCDYQAFCNRYGHNRNVTPG